MRHLRIVKPRDPNEPPRRRRSHAGSALSAAQQAKVKAALRSLKTSFGGWAPLAAAMGLPHNSTIHLISPRHVITGDMMIRVCKVGGISIDSMLGETLTDTGRCRSCGSRRYAS